MRTNEPDYLIPLSPIDYQILTALVGRPLYGYAIIDQCRHDSEGVMTIGPSSLYPALSRLERFHYIARLRQDPPAGSPHPRQIFELTATGHLVFEQETSRLRRAVYLAEHHLRTTIKP